MSEKSDDEVIESIENKKPKTAKKRTLSKRFKIIAIVLIAILIVPLSYAGYIYAATPTVIREPKLEHYHFRMQILVNGKAENFAEDKYQKGYVKDAQVVRDIGGGCGQEALRIVELMNGMPNRWTPGKQRGRAVKVLFNLPVKFKLEYN